MRRPVLAVAAAALILTGAAPVPAPPVTAFVDVTVVPMDREGVVAGQTVVVRGDHIAEVGPVKSVKVPEGAVRVDGRGRYLMPGLAEMHAHVPGGQAPDAFVERVLTLFVANGVTTIRGMLGHPRHLELRERIARGELLGPRLVTSGPSLNGNSVPTPEAAVKAVADQKAAGYDFLKIHPGISRPAFDALAAEAKTKGIPFAGHVPAAVGVEHALASGYRSIDHLDGYIEALVPDTAPVDRSQATFFGFDHVDHVDESRIPGLVARTRAAGTWLVPTQHVMEVFVTTDTPEAQAAWPEMRYVPQQTVDQWVDQRRQFASAPELTPARIQRFHEVRRRLLKAFHDGGANLLLGSDAIQVFSVPGFSIHAELESMVRAGLTPYQAYLTGTRNVARFLGDEKGGVVAAGAPADLVLLEADPLKDVASFRKQAGVMVRGRFLDKEEIARRLAALAR